MSKRSKINNQRQKLVFVHPQLRGYRLKLFEKINQFYEAIFTFQFSPKNVKSPKYFNTLILDRSNFLEHFLSLIKYLKVLDYNTILSSPAEGNHSLIIWIIAKLRKKKIILWGEGWADRGLEFWVCLKHLQFIQSANQLTKVIRRHITKKIFSRTDSFIATGEKPYNHYLKLLIRQNYLMLLNILKYLQ